MFTHWIDTQIHIDASAQQVWTVLTDFASYPQWNPFIRHISGELMEGARWNVSILPVGGAAMRFRPRVLTLQPQRALCWRGQFLVPGLFDGTHEFALETTAKGVTLQHRESFSGLLVPVLRRSLKRGTRPGFEAMNEALRKRVETA